MALLFQLTQRLSQGFAAAWSRWPRKDKKLDAEKAWHQKVKDEATEDKIHDAFDWQIPILLQRDPQYRPLLGSWLRGEEWNNEKPTPARAPMPTRNPAIVRPLTPEQTNQTAAVMKIERLIQGGMDKEQAKQQVYREMGWVRD